ncbi:MAG: NAD-dependent protein deacylase [Alphaproteobacteria bacterium]|nr:MAG: NAD-dependent protein deacylase [Alphaproteobacteria bacterium]
MTYYENIVILTGAGISAESGLDTFRDKGGIWAKYDLMELATPEAFARNPDLVHEFYNARREGVKKVSPNAAHFALAQLEQSHPGKVTLITQNVDPLHEKAGSKNLMHMHGELNKARCLTCHGVCTWQDDLSRANICPSCGQAGALRPHIVWFGEMPFHMDDITICLEACDLFISIGTSGSVYPAAGFVQTAHGYGAETVELNLEPSDGDRLFSVGHYGKATKIVPEYIAGLIKQD